MAGTMSIGGVISGLKTDDIITKMMDIARRPQNKLLQDKAIAQNKLAVWQDLNTRILALKTKADSIAVPGAFKNNRAISSEMGIVNATASADASPGIYYLKVKSRAQGHQISSQTFNSTNDNIGTGTVSFTFADNSKDFNVTIDNTNNTLSGLRDSINRADKEIQASIINSGTAESPEYRLMLTNKSTGINSEFTVNSGTTTTAFNQITQQAFDAEIEFGDGLHSATPITVKKSANSITDLIPGVTLDIGAPDLDKTVKIEVVRNTGAIQSSIEDFVKQYNDLTDAIDAQFKFDGQSGSGGALLGSWDLQSIQMTLASTIGSSVTGVNREFNVLAAVGITMDMAGHLTVDSSKLSSALRDKPEDVARLFASDLKSDSSYISLVTSSVDTKPSGVNGWEVNVTQAARRAQVTAGVGWSEGQTLDADETITVYTGSTKAKSIKLTDGMTIAQAVAEINKYSAETGIAAAATQADGTGTGNFLTLRTTGYGSTKNLSVFSDKSNFGTNTSGLGTTLITETVFTGEQGNGQGMPGLDVAGTINGEAATGNGQILSASTKSANSAIKGLMLTITSGIPITSKIYYTKGIGTTLRDTIIGMTGSAGMVAKAQESLTDEISEFDKNIIDMESRLTDQSDRIYAQFNAMEAQLAKLQQQGNYLANQLAAMNK